MEWIRTAKLKKYDVISAFSDLNEIDWRKSGFNIKTGDIVYIYVGKPYSRIMYKTICILDSVDAEKKFIEDNKYWVEENKNEEFYRIWTRKEALLKMNGEGIEFGKLKNIDTFGYDGAEFTEIRRGLYLVSVCEKNN